MGASSRQKWGWEGQAMAEALSASQGCREHGVGSNASGRSFGLGEGRAKRHL